MIFGRLVLAVNETHLQCDDYHYLLMRAETQVAHKW